MGCGLLMRRRALCVALGTTLSVHTSPSSARASRLTFNDACELIAKRTPSDFLVAVHSARRLLYRGEDMGGELAVQLCPAMDLLDEKTYASEDACSYFERLDEGLSRVGSFARPARGHIGVSRRDAASTWGAPCSVWPIGSELHYVWPQRQSDFWPATKVSLDELRVDEGLDEALVQGHEVMFAAATEDGSKCPCFIAVSAALDERIWKWLDQAALKKERICA